MPQMKSSVAILMGIIILIADIAWLIIGASYTYTPWLVLGIVIFVATLVWLAMDFLLLAAKTFRTSYDSKILIPTSPRSPLLQDHWEGLRYWFQMKNEIFVAVPHHENQPVQLLIFAIHS